MLETLARRGEIARPHLREARVREIRGLGRTQRGGTFEGADGLLDVVGHEQRDTELVQRIGMLPPQLENASAGREGALPVAAVSSEQAETEGRLPAVGLDRGRRLER